MSSDPLLNAILAAGNELANEHDWCFDGDIGPGPKVDNEFVVVLLKHLRPITDSATYVEARKAALRAELDALEKPHA